MTTQLFLNSLLFTHKCFKMEQIEPLFCSIELFNLDF